MRRDVTEVLDKVLSVVPASERLHARLVRLKSDAAFKPPESNDIWLAGTRALWEHLPSGPDGSPPVDGWQGEAVRIWTGRE